MRTESSPRKHPQLLPQSPRCPALLHTTRTSPRSHRSDAAATFITITVSSEASRSLDASSGCIGDHRLGNDAISYVAVPAVLDLPVFSEARISLIYSPNAVSVSCLSNRSEQAEANLHYLYKHYRFDGDVHHHRMVTYSALCPCPPYAHCPGRHVHKLPPIPSSGDQSQIHTFQDSHDQK